MIEQHNRIVEAYGGKLFLMVEKAIFFVLPNYTIKTTNLLVLLEMSRAGRACHFWLDRLIGTNLICACLLISRKLPISSNEDEG